MLGYYQGRLLSKPEYCINLAAGAVLLVEVAVVDAAVLYGVAVDVAGAADAGVAG